MREVALKVGITERAVQKIVTELVDSNYLMKERRGRRNAYQLIPEQALRHPLEQYRTVGDLIEVLKPTIDEKRD